MKEIRGDINRIFNNYDAVCVTTNGIIKSNGKLVMGAGIALWARDKFIGIDSTLAQYVKRFGNRPFKAFRFISEITNNKTWICSFPTKHNYNEDSDIELIKDSCIKISAMADKFGWQKILIPRPGCSNGCLKWYDVKKEIQPLLDDRFTIVSK